MKRERVGIFGGTFNPIHLGHIKAAESIQHSFTFHKLLFIPSYIPPHKRSEEVASPQHRLNMVKLAVSGFSPFEPSSIEIDAREKSYSIVTLRKIKKKYPEADIFFILGVDAFVEIETWKDYEKVMEQCRFIVISRPGYQLEAAERVLDQTNRPAVLRLKRDAIVNMETVAKYKVFLLPIEALAISSTAIRKRIQEGGSIQSLVSEGVKNYILENKLYQKEQ